MVNLITDKYISSSPVSKNFAYTSSVLPQKETQEIKPKIYNPDKTISEKQKKYISAGLITGGALLLYYGLTSPGKSKIFNMFIKNRIFEMEAIGNKYRAFVLDTIKSSFKETAEHITEFRKQHILNPTDSIIQIKMLTNPERIAYAQDLAFDAILNANRIKQGTNEIGTFNNKFNKIMHKVSKNIEKEKRRTMLELEDYVHLPKTGEEFSSNQIENAESLLMNESKSLDIHMSEFKDSRLNAIIKQQYSQMANAIVYSRKTQTITKQTIINTSFDKVKGILNLPDSFIPLYEKEMYDLAPMTEITKFLGLQKIPARIRRQTEPNVYTEILMKENLRNLSDKDLKKLFFRLPYDNNLKDLRYLIDRYRLKYAIANAQKSEDLPIYEGIIIKLEYLSNRLNEYGKKQLVSKCNQDFISMNIEQRKSALYYISTISKRLGYESLEAMDDDLYKTNFEYKNLKIHSHMPVIKENPALYFVE